METRRSFTLIELLIVVAIIAILAAIAVPNFLEAQVRAKVSRAKSELRSLTTALEAYRVDNTNYPLSALHGGPWLLPRLIPLTTPVAYVTTIPIDPFWVKFTHPGSILDKDTYDYFDYASSGDGAHTWTWTLYGKPWRLACAGPDLNQTFGNQPPYDSTNGTKSNGDIIRFQGFTDDNYLPLWLEYAR
jgi:type II secretion system protein G